MSIPGPLLPHTVEQGLVSSLLPRPLHMLEEGDPVRIGKVHKKNLLRPTLLHKKCAPVGIGRDGLAKSPAGWLTRPFSGVSPAGGASLGTVRPLYRQAKSAKRWPSKTILGSKSPASKTMWKHKFNTSGRETGGVCKRMDGYNPGPLHIGHNTRASATLQLETPLDKTLQQVWGKYTKDPEEHDGFRGQLNVIWGHTRVGPREWGILYISLPDSQENGVSCFIVNLKPLNQYITHTKFKMTILK